jgi:hypothetical protein
VPGPKRTPIAPELQTEVSARAVELYRAMKKCRCDRVPSCKGLHCPGCARWYALHAALHAELGLRSWVWPCILPPTWLAGPDDIMRPRVASVRMVALEARLREAGAPCSK